MLFYLTNEGADKISVEIPGYGQCVFSPGDTKSFEAANEAKVEARSAAAVEAGLIFKPESAFKSEVEPHGEAPEPQTATVGVDVVVTDTTHDASADASEDEHASGKVWADQMAEGVDADANTTPVEGMTDGNETPGAS